MKLAVLLLQFLSVSVFANVRFVPEYPTHCQEDKAQSKLINYIKNVEFSESEEVIKIEFETSYAKCIEYINYFRKMPKYLPVYLYSEEMTWPWTYVPDYQYKKLSETSGKITFTINKSKAFSDSNERKFSFKYAPRKKEIYLWHLHIITSKNSQAEIFIN